MILGPLSFCQGHRNYLWQLFAFQVSKNLQRLLENWHKLLSQCQWLMQHSISFKSLTVHSVFESITVAGQVNKTWKIAVKFSQIHRPGICLVGMFGSVALIIFVLMQTRSHLCQPDRLYEQIYQFLGDVWYTDVCMLYSPSQIALAAVMHSVTFAMENIDTFVIKVLLNNPPKVMVERVIKCVKGG